jgi:hypothetical protein
MDSERLSSPVLMSEVGAMSDDGRSAKGLNGKNKSKSKRAGVLYLLLVELLPRRLLLTSPGTDEAEFALHRKRVS